ncbi:MULTISPECIES: aspartate aminotransferase family protein [unclassified Corynebacterium]|uniref:aspartate aminotransferase family protein n=1 Tax=unclassified Corynebacterium TaxID=2624378 RepID=UPI001EF530DB|nr:MULTISPECIES: aspartate aminotransferase family protein [unclassified Corynebacterium]MCG7258786.1 aspartate aminotransferase family protein [Corynebacterium sp. ACRQK]MCG7263275.1 aspartate aminotransferase family protein [Corynebacterium sp. ACRQL]
MTELPPNITEFTTLDGAKVGVGTEEAKTAEQQVRDNDSNNVFHSWSAQEKINPQPLSHAEGVWIYDYQGNGYLDLGSQLVSANLGHAHPKLVEAIQQQATRITNQNPAFSNDVRSELAKEIVEQAQGDFSHVFFTNGGADAVEHAIRMARLTTGKSKILTAYRSYHGATGSAIMATGEARRHGNPTTDGDVKHFWGPFLYRSAFYSSTQEEECARALQSLEETLVYEDNVAAVLIESVVGSSGIIVPPEGFLQGVREICDRHGALYIADEVMVGFGRTGKMFAYEHGGKDLQPDLVTFAKGVNSGMAPLGGVMMNDAVYQRFADKPYPGGLTYSGHPLACAPGLAAQRVYREENTFEKVAELGERVIAPAMEKIAENHPSVGNVRGKGFFWAIEFVSDQEAKTPMEGEAMGAFGAELKKAGIWPMVSGHRLHFAPPLITTEEQLNWALEIVDRAAAVVDQAL